ncbi:Protein of unknown function [Cotesia congregata]|uniref:Uncharacterized protein n=1 Tax=Cotesia congregata TaxID=51543 RepID=A0A8J2MJJ5_COTCN|nr:Protein of unknown function [Cotesia congregata]
MRKENVLFAWRIYNQVM